MQVLVTGGAGFLGSHLVRALVADGDRVVALDDLSTGRWTSAHEAAERVTLDVRARDALNRAVREADLVFHLAAAVGTRIVARDPAGTWSRNVQGTAAVLDACARFATRVVVASSSEVYGPAGGGPLKEDDPSVLVPAGRRDVYALSKAAGEAYAFALHRMDLLPVTVVRLFNVVGPGQRGRYGMVLPRLVSAARARRPLPVHGDGGQQRCFLHVSDAVRAVRSLAACPAAEGLAVNVGSRQEVTILELARLVLRETGANVPIELVPLARVHGEGFADPRRRVPDLTRLETLTGFRAARTLRDAVRDLLRDAAAQPIEGGARR